MLCGLGLCADAFVKSLASNRDRDYKILRDCAYNGMFRDWYDSAIKSFIGKEDLLKHNLQPEYCLKKGFLGKSQITLRCEAFHSKHLRYIRYISFEGAGYNVLNFVALPKTCYNLPIFGADIVLLPGGALAAIDFQPLNNSMEYFQSHLYQPYSHIFQKWRDTCPSGGELPPSAASFFSPHALWTRCSIQDSSTLTNMGEAFIEYLTCYIDLLEKYDNIEDNPNYSSLSHDNCEVISNLNPTVKNDRMPEKFKNIFYTTESSRNEYMNRYLSYRIDNDPAQRMLVSAFGKDWTDKCLRNVMFPSKP